MRSIYYALGMLLALTSISPLTQAAALDDYVQQPDADFKWEVYAEKSELLVKHYFLRLTSQRWRSSEEVDRTLWQHELKVSVPNSLLCGAIGEAQDVGVLLISGGKNPATLSDYSQQVDPVASLIAVSLCRTVAELKQVPNQPLRFSEEHGRERSEDEILGYSMQRFLQSGDSSWPVHLAMTKAAVRAMDALQAFSRSDKAVPDLNSFIVLGGSKRGWATWLTAVADQRVKGIIPISIDMLNLDQQFRHHWESYGEYSTALNNYSEFDLPCRVDTEAGQALLSLVDPYRYRERLSLPKLIVNSAGDQFFASDSARFYIDQLSGDTRLRYTPNTDHGQGDEEAVLNLFLATRSWMDDVIDGKTPPGITWQFEDAQTIRVQTTEKPRRVRLWQANNPAARDFRLETIGEAWTASELIAQADGSYVGRVIPSTGWTAYMVEATFVEGATLESDQVVTTPIRVYPDTLPYQDTACQTPSDYSGIWYNPTTPGQYFELAQQGGTGTGVWYHFDETGQPRWWLFRNQGQANRLSGDLLEWQDNAYRSVGRYTLSAEDSRLLLFNYQVGEIQGRLYLTPYQRLPDFSTKLTHWWEPNPEYLGWALSSHNGMVAGINRQLSTIGKPQWVRVDGTGNDGNRFDFQLKRLQGSPIQLPLDSVDKPSTELVGYGSGYIVNSSTLQLDYLTPSSTVQQGLVPLRLP